MAYQLNIYDAFSGMNPMEKDRIIRFLNAFESDNKRENIAEAVEYAVKLKPSFGGFVLTAEQDDQIVGAIVANRTGMGSYNPNHILVFVTLHQDFREDEALTKRLIQKAIQHAKGDIAMHVKPDNPALQLYEKIGFKAQYLELRLSKKDISAVA
jgi:ribosomal protein S18 acetylase RimI-like enzyme